MIKRIIGGLCGVAVALNLFSVTVGSKASFNETNNGFFKASSRKNVHIDNIEIKFEGTREIHPEQFKANYTEISYTSLRGEKAYLQISNGEIVLEADSNVEIELSVVEYYTGDVVFREEGKKVISVECASDMKENVAYYAEVYIKFAANEFYDDALVLSVDNKDKLYFVESPVYKYNVESFRELKDTDEYLKKCLEPEKDMESDNEDIIRISNEICEGARTDYEKVDKIYSFIVEEMYYDYDQVYDYKFPYEDDALSLIRRKIAVCEGFSNVFVALCRAQGIPACETFGSGYSSDELWALNMSRVTSANHAWVAVFVGGQWQIMDPTWDNMNEYLDGEATKYDSTRDYVFIPMESFSFTHIYFDADITHATVRSGSCGDDATYEIDEDGVCTIYGSGELIMPEEANDFTMLVFDKDSEITSIGVDGVINCDLVNYIILPDTIEEIGDYAFYHCENLEYVYIPDTVTRIGNNAFWICDKLSFIEVPDGTRVGSDAFDMCPRLVLSVESDDQVYTKDYDVDVAQIIVRD